MNSSKFFELPNNSTLPTNIATKEVRPDNSDKTRYSSTHSTQTRRSWFRKCTFGETAAALLCFLLLCIFGLIRGLDTSLPFVQRGVASRLNVVAPFLYAATFLISSLHYSIVHFEKMSASLKELEVCFIAASLAWITTLLVFDAATGTDIDKSLIAGLRYGAWLDAPLSAGVFIVIFVLSRSFTPSSLTITTADSVDTFKKPLLSEEDQAVAIHSENETSEIGKPQSSLLTWHATLDPALTSMPLERDDETGESADVTSIASMSMSPNRARVNFRMKRINSPLETPWVGSNVTSPFTMPQFASKSKHPSTVRKTDRSVEANKLAEFDNPFSTSQTYRQEGLIHQHFDGSWDWARQCILGVLIVSWVNQSALLTDGLRVKINEGPPPIAILQAVSSVLLLISAYFEFLICPLRIQYIRPLLWRFLALGGLVVTIVVSDGLLLRWQATV